MINKKIMGRGKIVVLAIALIFLLVRIASAAAAPDPTRISIGARVLGLGSACMGLDGIPSFFKQKTAYEILA